jgi:putative acyl-CoA dehydrogenase
MPDKTNQPPSFEDVNLFATNRALKEAVDLEGGSAHTRRLDVFGARMGSAEAFDSRWMVITQNTVAHLLSY